MQPSELISERFAISPNELQSYVQTCPYRYKTYPIRKRGGGTRTISQPSKDLKVVQRFVLESFLNSRLQIHESAKAYKLNTNILDNAMPHMENQYLLKLDFREFFPSIVAQDFMSYLLSNKIVDSDREADLLAKIFFKIQGGTLRLSIGSPGSPVISNALLYEFDELVSTLCDETNITFTRYSDDMTFSTNVRNILFHWPSRIASILSELVYPKFVLNDDKTVFSSKKFNRHVTGITITNDGRPSIGHTRKRALRTNLFEASKLSSKQLLKLRGHIAFATQIEPELLKKYWKKYPQQMKLVMSAT